MTKEKQIPITLVTGLSDRLKLSLIKDLKLQKQSKVILFRDPTVTKRDSSKEYFLQENILSEVVHDLGVSTKKELLSIIDESSNREIDHLIIDLEKFSSIQLLFPHNTSIEENFLLNLKHIHIIDAVSFWFQYSSNDCILSQCPNEEEINESSIGELLISALELADRIILSNGDKINQERLAELQWFLSKLNPLAKIITTNDTKITNNLFTETVNGKKYTSHELYKYQLQLFEQKKPFMIVGDYGIDTYIYRSPFSISLKNLEQFFSELPEGILRTKAICFNPLEKEIYYLSQIGPSIEIFSEEQSFLQSTNKVLTEFLFIGDNLSPNSIRSRLEKYLLKEDCLPTKKISR